MSTKESGNSVIRCRRIPTIYCAYKHFSRISIIDNDYTTVFPIGIGFNSFFNHRVFVHFNLYLLTIICCNIYISINCKAF